MLAEIAGASRLPKNIGERGAVQQSQVQSLTGQRVHHMRRVAEQHSARPRVLQGILQLERKTRQLGRQFAVSQDLTAGRGQGGTEGLRVQRAEACRLGTRGAPHDGRAAVRQRQEGKGS